jgi:hypothetical protein
MISLLESVLRQLEAGDNNYHQEPAPVKKFLMGDATWATRKVILGWLMDTVAMTIQLPHHRLAQLFEILDMIGHQ